MMVIGQSRLHSCAHSLITTRRHWDTTEMTTAWLTTLLLLYTTAFSLTHTQGSALSAYTPQNQCRKVSLIHIYPFMLEIHVCVYYRIGVGNFLILDSLSLFLVHFHAIYEWPQYLCWWEEGMMGEDKREESTRKEGMDMKARERGYV